MKSFKGWLLLVFIAFMALWSMNTLFGLNIAYGLKEFIAVFSLMFSMAFIVYLGSKEK